jgi:hypothetical protein
MHPNRRGRQRRQTRRLATVAALFAILLCALLLSERRSSGRNRPDSADAFATDIDLPGDLLETDTTALSAAAGGPSNSGGLNTIDPTEGPSTHAHRSATDETQGGLGGTHSGDLATGDLGDRPATTPDVGSSMGGHETALLRSDLQGVGGGGLGGGGGDSGAPAANTSPHDSASGSPVGGDDLGDGSGGTSGGPSGDEGNPLPDTGTLLPDGPGGGHDGKDHDPDGSLLPPDDGGGSDTPPDRNPDDPPGDHGGDGPPVPVPEPTALTFLGAGLVLAGRTLKNRRTSQL